MDSAQQLAQFIPDPALAAYVDKLLAQVKQDAELIQQNTVLLQQNTAQILTLTKQIQHAELKNQALVLELAYYRRIRFANKSEQLSPEQRALFDECWAADITAIEAQIGQPDTPNTEDATTAIPKPARPRAGRQPLPDHLPRIIHRHEPASCQCGACGGALIKIGEDISEQLDVEPAQFTVHQHIRPQYACRHCETVAAAPIPAAVIDGGVATSGLLAWVMISKFVDHLPLYRIEHIAQRSQVTLARSTLAEWVGRVGVALQPLVDRLTELLLARSVLHADETPVPQLDPGAGKTKKAYLWAYRTGDLASPSSAPPIVVFDYQPGRQGLHARHFLAGWQGHLMVDDYAGYKALFTQGITELACFAHARRKFFDLHAANQSPIAAAALQRIAALYAIEQAADKLDAAGRLQLRQTQAKPLLGELHDWLIQTRVKVADGSGTARALDYSIKRWPALIRYADSGILPIDNNPVENAIRPIAIGKKNWLFAGSERAGKRAAAIQSLLATAKLNGLEPYAWLKDTLEKLPVWR
ncbi:IS66 family transposase [Sulfuriferula nivalis]|uniref:IS66 family transposase n=1 Tax=Sulfuriferula nivalis TaxID=2675298 RepID=A0A809RZN5_9PROT|nr:IS66 family transposase [Sulfuriferula nivalis]BBO99687.1 IS66 family transposase [Sulfuriferula nivalis]